MKSVLEELYYGDLVPNKFTFTRASSYDRAIKLVCDNEENLLATLEKPEKSMFIDFLNAQSEITGLTAIENFSYGFKLGATMMLEVFAE